MRSKLSLLLLLAVFMPLFALSQNVRIVGKTNRPNTLVRLLTYDNMLTCWQTQIAENQSDKEGKFVLEATVNEITPVEIAVGLERVDFIICPDADYDIEISIAERQADMSYFDAEPPTMYINTINDGGFYAQYLAVSDIVDQFIYDNVEKIVRGRNLKILDELDNQIDKSVGQIKFKYVNDLVKYRKASVMLTVNKRKVMTECFDNQEVLYLLPAYMEVFQELFNTDINDADFLSRNPQLAELITMNNIKKAFFSNVYDKKTALKALDNIKKSSKYQKNKAIATNIEKQFNDLTYNAEAPAFLLKDKNGNTVQLSDYQDGMVLLQFVDRYTPLNEPEFFKLNELQKQWNDTIQVVTIATKEWFESYTQLFEKQEFKWQLLNLGDDILLLEKYHVRLFPAYVILKKKGRVGMAPAPAPDHNLENHVRRISKYL